MKEILEFIGIVVTLALGISLIETNFSSFWGLLDMFMDTVGGLILILVAFDKGIKMGEESN